MVVFLLNDRLENFLRGYFQDYGPQPTGILSPNRLVKVQRDDLLDTRGNSAKVGKRLDGIGDHLYQPLSAQSFISDRSLVVYLPTRGQAPAQDR